VSLPDVEALAVGQLLEDPMVSALADDRVGVDLPASFPDGQRVRLMRVGGTPVDAETEHLDRALVQVETFGSTKEEAFDLTLVVIDSLKAMPAAQFDGAVVTLVSRVTGPRWSPDPPTDTPRYITDVVLYAHTVGG
jgi:hypothetical protein